ncbi:hemerythrin domain-containing protein [Candidatus Woesearchaeota archaeon]|nr:hemerythrin domain-containing protein [Candidatus Woesearchaeota archaeon]
MPIGLLMIEHRLIERMVGLLEKELNNAESGKKVDSELIYSAVDFFRTYADRTHHGKEEDVLFRELEKKPLSAEHKKIMGDLVAEHAIARKNVKSLFEANQKYAGGDSKALLEIAGYLKTLTSLYPEHIQKEDKHFFIPIMDYFSKEEQDSMLKEFFEFDKNMIHEKYRKVVEQYE